MSYFLLGCLLGLLIVGCIAVPFVAPWRIRLRYLIAAQVADPVFGVGPPPGVTLCEVSVTHVVAERGHVDLVVEEVRAGRRVAPRRAFTRQSCAPADLAKLDGWSATFESLLMIVDECGDTHLFGPDGAVTYVNRIEARTR